MPFSDISFSTSVFRNKSAEPSAVYGYVTDASALLDLYQQHLTQPIDFLDLGSGDGRLVLEMVSLGAANARGIENDPHRHRLAIRRQADLDKTLRDKTTLELGDAKVVSFKRANAIFANNMLFDDATNTAIARNMRDSRQRRVLITTGSLAGLTEIGTACVAMSWTECARVYIYASS